MRIIGATAPFCSERAEPLWSILTASSIDSPGSGVGISYDPSDRASPLREVLRKGRLALHLDRILKEEASVISLHRSEARITGLFHASERVSGAELSNR